MMQPRTGNVVDFRTVPWAADNGCFSQGEHFRPEAWLDWLASMAHFRDTCAFAVAPDVLGDARATLERALPYLPILRGMGYRSAYVLQNGQESFAPPWDEFDALFLGASGPWKFSVAAHRLAAEGKERGKWLHYGRVNSLRRLQTAQVGQYDSADGTHVKFAPTRGLAEIYQWLDRLNAQAPLLPAIGTPV